jgi:beta-galactosidase/beta-glucuronidase
MKPGDRTVLHIGASDYRTEVYVNGRPAGSHIGGYTAFSFDITDKLRDGENDITICADDNQRSGTQPHGKQCDDYFSAGCSYTRTTGIWQTVWLEAVPAAYIKETKYITNPAEGKLIIEAECVSSHGKTFIASVSFGGEYITSDATVITGDTARLDINLDGFIHPWAPAHPDLYDLQLYIMDGQTEIDAVKSYFAMRSVAYDASAHRFMLNGEPVFMRLILDQGFYPDGIYTASCDGELIADIKRSMDMGFNGARLHQKIFEPRFLYHCDRLGYMVWGEHGNWGLDLAGPAAWQGFIPEWLEMLRRDFNHPSIIGWCPLNETQRNQNPVLIKTIYSLTKAYDTTRPVIDCSGWNHVITDILDAHDYNQDPTAFKANFDRLIQGGKVNGIADFVKEIPADLSFISEYGGIWWQPGNPEKGWGYGNRPATEEEFIGRYRGLTEALLDNPMICGFCYTQLTDVEQEVNGLYYYGRQPKFDPAVIRAITSRKAACEN